MNDELTKAVDELIDTARALEWHYHFGGHWDKWRDELALARKKVLEIGASAGGRAPPPTPDLAIPTGEAGAPNLPTDNCQLCGAGKYDVVSIVDGVCVSCETPHEARIIEHESGLPEGSSKP